MGSDGRANRRAKKPNQIEFGSHLESSVESFLSLRDTPKHENGVERFMIALTCAG